MSKRTFAVLVAVASLAVASTAAAEEKGNVTTLKTTVVVGRYVRPSVVIEVARATPAIKLKDLNDPKVEKILRAAAKAPF